MKITTKAGPKDTLCDIQGLLVGHAHDAHVNTGTTAIIPDANLADGFIMGVDIRGGGPGTRETPALDPACLVTHFHGLILSGGSVFGLAAADGATQMLSSKGRGLSLGGDTVPRVPVVPAAILFDLANGGDKSWEEPPYRTLGAKAVENANDTLTSGRFGAGFGARAGAMQGGIGTASFVKDDGCMVAALVAVNSFGTVTNDNQINDHLGTVDLPKLGILATNTTIGVVATNAALDKAGCKRLAMMAHDGLARTIKPIHTPFDGDTIFAISTGTHTDDQALEPKTAKAAALDLAVMGTLAADCMAQAIMRAVNG